MMALVKRLIKPVPNDDRCTSGRDLGSLILALTAPDSESRRRSALDLAGRPEAVTQLVARVAVESDAATREALLTALAVTGGPQVVALLVPQLRSSSAAVRAGVLDALAQIEATQDVVPDLLVDPDPDMRVRSVMLVGQLRHPARAAWLTQVVRTDTQARVVGSALGELVTGGDLSAAQVVAACAAAAGRFPGDPYLEFLAETTLATAASPIRVLP